jgi:hypothetical protein
MVSCGGVKLGQRDAGTGFRTPGLGMHLDALVDHAGQVDDDAAPDIASPHGATGASRN